MKKKIEIEHIGKTKCFRYTLFCARHCASMYHINNNVMATRTEGLRTTYSFVSFKSLLFNHFLTVTKSVSVTGVLFIVL